MSEPSSTSHLQPEASSSPSTPPESLPTPPSMTETSATVTPSATSATPRRVANAAPAEPSLFDEASVTVSATRIVAYGTPFPLKDARSVRLFVDAPHVRFAIPILIAGLLLGAYGIFVRSSPLIALGFMLSVVSYLTYRFQTMRHRLFLIRDSGETEVLVGSNLPFVQRVKAALESALTSPTLQK